MKIILSGGGTGGHIYPAIAIANACKQQDPTVNILFVGASGKMEMKSVPEAGYPIVGLSIRGLQRKHMLQNVGLPFRLLASLGKAQKILKNFQPDVVVGTGGYASAPILYMATRQNIPTLIHEQNATVGLTNQILARYVNTMCVAYPNMKVYLSSKKMVLTGTPIREDFLHLSKKREAAHTYFGLTPHKKCLLVLGGTLGARTINESILQAMEILHAAEIQIIWATGHTYFVDIQAKLSKQQRNTVKIYPFIKAMHFAYAAADVVVSRAGALAVAELCVVQKPVIFVPSPNVTANHQTHNILPLVTKNAARMITDHEASKRLVQAVLQLLRSEAQQRVLTNNMKAWAKPQASASVVQEIMQLANTSNR